MSQSECESTGSNSSSQSKKKPISGKRKRVTNCSSSSSSIMVDWCCPASKNSDYQDLCVILLENRHPNIREYDVGDMEKQKGKAFWDYITELYNAKRENNVPRDHVVNMALRIQEFHNVNACDCIGKALATCVRDRGPVVFPNEIERAEWNKIDAMANQQICQISGSSMTSETSLGKRPRMMPLEYEGTLWPSKLDFIEAQGEQIQFIHKHYNMPSRMKVQMTIALTLNPSMVGVVLQFSEEELIHWLKGVVGKDVFESWHAEWTARS